MFLKSQQEEIVKKYAKKLADATDEKQLAKIFLEAMSECFEIGYEYGYEVGNEGCQYQDY
jgi:hypothetical protein